MPENFNLTSNQNEITKHYDLFWFSSMRRNNYGNCQLPIDFIGSTSLRLIEQNYLKADTAFFRFFSI